MTKDFIIVTGHGIFPVSTILQVVPVTEVHFDLNITPPSDSDPKFIFSVVKTVSINAEIARSNPTKKNEVESLTDYGYNRQFSDGFDFAEDELLAMIGLEDDDTVKGHIKDWNRRYKKVADYETAVKAIESNPDLPDYATSLLAIKNSAPGDSYFRKQDKTLAKLKTYILDHIMTVVESASDDDDDYTGKPLMDVLNSEDRLDAIEHAANQVLKDFYHKNFSNSYDDNDDEEDLDDTEEGYFDVNDSDDEVDETSMNEALKENARQAVDRGLAIRQSPDTISNALASEKDEDDSPKQD